MRSRQLTINEVHAVIQDALLDLAPLFKPEMLLTFIARMPGHPESEMVVTEDDLSEVSKAVTRMRKREKK